METSPTQSVSVELHQCFFKINNKLSRKKEINKSGLSLWKQRSVPGLVFRPPVLEWPAAASHSWSTCRSVGRASCQRFLPGSTKTWQQNVHEWSSVQISTQYIWSSSRLHSEPSHLLCNKSIFSFTIWPRPLQHKYYASKDAFFYIYIFDMLCKKTNRKKANRWISTNNLEQWHQKVPRAINLFFNHS